MYKKHIFEKIMLFLSFFLLSGFYSFPFHPSGEISIKQYNLIFIAFAIMLLIVLPVIFMTIFFVYNYRVSKKNTYNPQFIHSKKIELIVWIVPIIIIFFLGILAWNTTHSLDPKKKIQSTNHPIIVDVIALDWKWLFIYPKYNIATVNELIIPVDTPIIFHITSNSVMSSFFIPSLGSQIYAMPGMDTKLNLISNIPGIYTGFSSNYNGYGFSNMKFNTVVVQNSDIFSKWIKKIQHISHSLDTISVFNSISKPSILYNIEYFNNIYPNLFARVVCKSI
ncbi:Cytochrome bo(3) ubiquinol oxidase subunit 2 [Buchnera aphidicola (Pterocallis alni)]|uniref:ubiquinol oxidase subunit II n=1 Tax=Buchnera aphidicola TaxID=9 RepID=UPI003464E8C6